MTEKLQGHTVYMPKNLWDKLDALQEKYNQGSGEQVSRSEIVQSIISRVLDVENESAPPNDPHLDQLRELLAKDYKKGDHVPYRAVRSALSWSAERACNVFGQAAKENLIRKKGRFWFVC